MKLRFEKRDKKEGDGSAELEKGTREKYGLWADESRLEQDVTSLKMVLKGTKW